MLSLPSPTSRSASTILFDGQDPIAYILSANITRRHMSKGQRAIVVAKIHPEPKRGIHSELPEETGELSKAHLSRARFVVRYASDLADNVRAGSLSIENAYEKARIRKGRAETYEARFNALKVPTLRLLDLRSIERRFVVKQRLRGQAVKYSSRAWVELR